jgi:hypothetical protein
LAQVHDMGRVAFQEGEEAAWEDLEQVYLPAADAGELPIRLYSFVPLMTWCVLRSLSAASQMLASLAALLCVFSLLRGL